jgi:uncharacterized RDD family membrane protein YckC
VQAEPEARATETTAEPGQQALFPNAAAEPRVIPFETLTSPAERESIRARAADLSRPAPLKTAKVEVRHARPRKASSSDQRRLEFLGQEQVLGQPKTDIICDAPVAPPSLRTQAALVDGLLMAAGSVFGLVAYAWAGGSFVLDKHVVPFLAIALLTVPVFYKALWTIAGCDSIGMTSAGLRLVNFDGNPPSHDRRYHRMFGSFISLLAGGIGMIWALVDEDGLTWHDHISSTFPTIASEN